MESVSHLPDGPSLDEFGRTIRSLGDRAVQIRGHVAASEPADRARAAEEAYVGLDTALEELRVAEEELRAQNEELIERQLAAEEERGRFRDLFDLAPDAYLVTDLDGIIREANRAGGRLLGVEPHRLVGKPLAVLVPVEERRALRERLNALRGGAAREEMVLPLATRDGAVVPAAAVAGLMHARHGAPRELCWLLRAPAGEHDRESATRIERLVAERTAALQGALAEAHGALVETRRERDAATAALAASQRVLAELGHELRTPLNAIGGYADLLLLDEHDLRDELRRYAESIRRGQEHILTLVTSILDHQGLALGVEALEVADVSVQDTLTHVHMMVAPQMQAKGLRYQCSTEESGTSVRADRARLEQILINLLANAVKFTQTGGRVWTDWERRGERVHIHVRDDGCGIPHEQQEAVFQPFVRGSGGRGGAAGDPHGLGLGLAISRALARRMHGDLTLRSVPGVGSSFTLSLPAGGRRSGAG
jgi:PAS domain S-box-containing protein